MEYKLTIVRFSQVPPNTYFTYKGNSTWIKTTWKERIQKPHNAYRTDYGTTPQNNVGVWCKLFDDNDLVQVRVLEV